MRTFILAVSLGIITLGCSDVEQKLPNIILVMADDQGWGDMGYTGHPILETPHFDAMASEGIRFDRFYAAAPVCSPTRGSVMTGRHPNRFGCYSWGRTLRPQEVTIAEILQEAGYTTGHFGKWHLGSVMEGSPVNPGESGFDEWMSAPNYFDNDPILSREGIAFQSQGESSMITVDAALDFISKHEKSDKPYFAVVWFGSPHSPHLAIAGDREIYADQPEDFQHFYGEITGMDHAFGKLRKKLKESDSYSNTILWYCSDNGGLPKYGSTGGRGHKGQIYEGGLRVPAILQWPMVFEQSGIINAPANTSDIYPTLLDLAGITVDVDRPLDGISLVPLIEQKTEKRSIGMGFWSYPADGVGTPGAKWMSELLEAQKNGNMVTDSSRLRLDAGQITKIYSTDTLPGHAAWLEWPWKLHRISDQEGNLEFELYNLESDSMEVENLAEIHPDRISEMKVTLEAWQVSVVRSMNGEDY
jgi:arylsulfatase A-like enzyme